MTLTSLLNSAADLRAARAGFSDGPDTWTWLGHAPVALSNADLRTRSQYLAAQLASFGIGAGDVVLLLLPNTIAYPVALLACQLIGALPAPVPVHWPVDAIRGAAEAAGAVAIVTTAGLGALALAERARQAAARVLQIRFVLAFGAHLPEGVIALDDWAEEDRPEPARLRFSDAATMALITFEQRGRAMIALARSHAQIVCDAMAIATLAGLDGTARLIATLPPASAAGVAAGLALPLMTGAEVHLHTVFDGDVFLSQFDALRGAHVLVPGEIEEPLAALARQDPGLIAGALFVQRGEDGLAGRTLPFSAARALDLITLGECAVIPRRRSGNGALDVLAPRIEHPVTSVLPAGQPMLETALDGYGRVMVAGFSCPTLYPLAEKPMPALATALMAAPAPGGARLQAPLSQTGSRDAA